MPTPEPAEYFANLPEEFKRSWLPARVNSRGWPAELHVSEWSAVLGEDPACFRLRTWREVTLDISIADWCGDTASTLDALRATCLGMPPTPGWRKHLDEAARKTKRIAEYASAHRALPSHLLTIRRPDGLFLVDGYHRVTWHGVGRMFAGAAFPVSPVARCFEGILP